MPDFIPSNLESESLDPGSSPVLSSRQAADLLGVHESSVKRWCNQGELAFELTTGGHRRISLRTAIDFARAHHTDTRLLSFPGQEEHVWLGVQATRDDADYGTLASLAYEWAEQRATDRLIALWDLMRDAGISNLEIFDRVVARVMKQIGDRWETGSIGTGDEHRMTQVMQDSVRAGIAQLGSPPRPHVGTAVVGCAPDEQHEMAALLVRIVLEEMGWDVVYLGPDVPAEDFAVQQRRHDAHLVCVSISPPRGLNEARALTRLLSTLYDDRKPYRLALGGPRFGGRSIEPGPFEGLGLFAGLQSFSAWLGQNTTKA